MLISTAEKGMTLLLQRDSDFDRQILNVKNVCQRAIILCIYYYNVIKQHFYTFTSPWVSPKGGYNFDFAYVYFHPYIIF